MTPQNPPVHRCVHCSREFNRSEHLIRHERTHTKEKPYKCGLCSQAFSRRDLLRRHELKAHHVGQKPRKLARSRYRDENIATRNSSTSHQITRNDDTNRGTHGTPLSQETSTTGDEGLGIDKSGHQGLPGETPVAFNEMSDFLQEADLGLEDSMQDYLLPDTMHWLDTFNSSNTCNLTNSLDQPESTMIQPVSELLSNMVSGTFNSPRARRRSILSQPVSPGFQQSPCHATAANPSPKDHLSITETYWSQMQLDVTRLNSTFVLPARCTLSRFIVRYFGSFHRHQPFLHEPTWSPNESPVALVLAVCANGALYSLERTIALELYKLSIDMMSTADNDLHGLQTMMLLTAVAAWSGTEDDLKIALQFHGRLTLAVRQEWTKSRHPESLDTFVWDKWRWQESLKRVTFCVFTVMNLMTIAYDIPSPLLLESRYGMPAHEDQWCAETETDWIQVAQWVGPQIWQSAQAIIERLGDESLPVPSNIGMFGCHVLISFLLQKIVLFRRSYSTTEPGYLQCRQHFLRVLKRWQLMWEDEPESSLSPDHPRGPILFNCTAILRLAYIRLVSDYSPIRGGFAACCSEEDIANTVAAIEPPIRGVETTRAVLQACLALRIPAQLGFKVVARTSFWVWSVQHALSYFECALLLSKWLQGIHDTPDLSPEEQRIVDLLEQSTGRANGELSAEESSQPLAVLVLLRWAELLNTEDTTVWQIMPKMSRVLRLYANRLSK